jgi:uncharacterized repeat protein (TIGR03803 family)
MRYLLKSSIKSIIALLPIAFVSLVGAQTLQTMCSFNNTNGLQPLAALTLGSDGNFYGTTDSGGSNGYGTVFKFTTNGTLNTLVSFNNTNGAYPQAGLTLGPDGSFYGTTCGGGSGNEGTVFNMTTNGILTTLVSFYSTNGFYPVAGLTLGPDGNFYGTTLYGTTLYGGYYNGYGTVFKVTTNGVFTILVNFNGTNGAYPQAGLALGPDGNLYGTTSQGGTNGGTGTVFKLTTNGTLTTLVSFNNTNGAYPHAGLTLGNDGNFYGTTDGGGINGLLGGSGNVFMITTNGALNTLMYFNQANGVSPQATLSQGSDGNFYGTTSGGGSGNHGTVFKIGTDGTLTTLVYFDGTNGSTPQTALTLGTDGNFYGTTVGGGSVNAGTVFRLLLPLTISIQPQSQTEQTGATVTFFASATSLTTLGYQWQKNGTNLIDSGRMSGANTNALTITDISESDTAVYSVIVSNSNFSITNYATLTVIDPPIITAQPTNLLVLTGANVAFGVSLTGSASYFRYQWQFNGTNLVNATNAVYIISAVATNKAGNYSVVVTNAAGRAVSSNAALSLVLPPKSQTNYASSTANFTVATFSPESLNFQWQKNGTNLANVGNISGATNSTLTIANLSDADAAIYSAVVSDAANSVTTSNATLTVNDSLFITTQPLSQTIGVGSNVTFTATAYGAPPFIFQWYYSNSPAGSPTSGTNVSSYTLTNVQTNQSGNYSVQVINGLSNLTSSNALLTVKVFPPTVGIQPTNQRVLIGGSASFVVSVGGTAPFVYHWRFNGTNILGATNAAYTIPTVAATNTGNYSVVITNSAGSVTSSNAFLTVIVPPTMALQLLAGYPVLNLNGMLSNNFVVQYNTDLTGTNWITLHIFSNLLTSPYQFLDPSGSSQPARFYRVWMQ